MSELTGTKKKKAKPTSAVGAQPTPVELTTEYITVRMNPPYVVEEDEENLSIQPAPEAELPFEEIV
jgi:hypothetical protein